MSSVVRCVHIVTSAVGDEIKAKKQTAEKIQKVLLPTYSSYSYTQICVLYPYIEVTSPLHLQEAFFKDHAQNVGIHTK